jgi:hypothetical protein
MRGLMGEMGDLHLLLVLHGVFSYHYYMWSSNRMTGE